MKVICKLKGWISRAALYLWHLEKWCFISLNCVPLFLKWWVSNYVPQNTIPRKLSVNTVKCKGSCYGMWASKGRPGMLDLPWSLTQVPLTVLDLSTCPGALWENAVADCLQDLREGWILWLCDLGGSSMLPLYFFLVGLSERPSIVWKSFIFWTITQRVSHASLNVYLGKSN